MTSPQDRDLRASRIITASLWPRGSASKDDARLEARYLAYLKQVTPLRLVPPEVVPLFSLDWLDWSARPKEPDTTDEPPNRPAPGSGPSVSSIGESASEKDSDEAKPT